MLVSMPYREMLNYNIAGAPGYTVQVFGTSIYDPDTTGTGHQPQGYDQYTNFFLKNRCYAITGTIKIINTSAIPIIIGTAESEVASLVYGLAPMLEDSTTLTSVVGVTPDNLTIPVNLSAARVCGMTTEQYRTDDNAAANFGGNPNRIAYLLTMLTTQDYATAFTCQVEYNLVFHCELFARRQLNSS